MVPGLTEGGGIIGFPGLMGRALDDYTVLFL